MPRNVTVRVSTSAFVTPESPGEVTDRLDVSWSHPSLDSSTQLFDTSDGGESLGTCHLMRLATIGDRGTVYASK